MTRRTVLTEDGTERKKLKVSLPGGRFQLSLDDAAVGLLCNGLNLGNGDFVPEPIVPFLVATGDAWFPRERDTGRIVEDLLPTEDTLTDRQRAALVEYLTTVRISPRFVPHVETVLSESSIADELGRGDLRINELPKIPEGIDLSGGSTESSESRVQSVEKTTSEEVPVDDAATTTLSSTRTVSSPDEKATERSIDETDLLEIPGIGSHRAEKLLEGGYVSVAQIAESRPSDVDSVTGISEQLATVAIEGAREIVGYDQSTATRLADETGVDEETFDAALSPLAASGIPPSEASPVLRVLYGPSLVDIEGVTGQQAYYLWDCGYQTPHDVASASVEELCDVPYIGEQTAVAIRDEARAFGRQ